MAGNQNERAAPPRTVAGNQPANDAPATDTSATGTLATGTSATGTLAISVGAGASSAGSGRFRLPRRRRRAEAGVSLAENLSFLVACVALPLMLLGGAALWMQYRIERADGEAQLLAQARTTALLIDREFERTLAVAQTLAEAVPLARGNLDALEGQLRAARDMLAATPPTAGPRPIVSLMDAAGLWLLHSEWAPGERRTGLPGTVFGQAAIAEGQAKISDLYTGMVGQPPHVGVAVPVFAAPAAGGARAVAGGVGISLPREHLIAIVRAAGLPPGAVASVIDRNGIIVARSFHDGETVGRHVPPAVWQMIRTTPFALAPGGTLTLENVVAATAFAHAPFTGYTLKIDIPEAMFLAPLRLSLWHSALVGIVVLAAGLATALVSARRVVAAFRAALRGAVHQDAAAPPGRRTGLREADDLAALLATAFAERAQAHGNARALLDNSPIGIVIFDAAGRVREANEAFLAIVGRRRLEPGRDGFEWNETTPARWVARDVTALAEALATGRCTPYEKEYVRRDGTVVPVLTSLGLIDRAGGLVAAFVIDLSERRAQEASQREVEDRLSFSLAAGRLGAWELDLASQRIRRSEQSQRLFGRFIQGDIGLPALLAMVHPDDRFHVRDLIARATADGRDFCVEFRAIWPDQSVHWLEVRGKMVREAGRPGRLIGVSADVTERRQAEAAVRESETRLRAITDAMPQIVWSARPDGSYDYFNQRCYHLTGATPAQVLRNGWIAMFHPDDQAATAARWRHSIATGEPYEIEHRLRLKDGDYRWMLGRAVPIRDEADGQVLHWFGTCTDIEQSVAAREILSRSREELEQVIAERTKDLQATQVRLAQAQRMEALGQLAGGIAHDFNNVLQAIQCSGALLERSPADSAGVRRHAAMVLGAVERGIAVTQRLLAFSRRGDLRAEPVEPAVLLTSMRDILSHTLGDGVKVAVALSAHLPALLADKGQLETVLINLATNGRDAMGGIGTLTLSAQPETVTGDQPDHRGQLKPGRYIRLAVSDTGAGMGGETLARACEPFFTTKPTGKGTGLGLAMARGFVEQSGGGMHIKSAPGRGTTVTLWFPLAEADRQAAPAAAEHPAKALTGQRNARLLLVDDDDIVREVTAELMETMGFRVLEAASAEAALAVLDGQAVDILISDLSMPDMDGVALIREAKTRRPGLPAILLTGFATNAAEIAIDGAISGGFSLLRKPIEAKLLAERVTSLIEAAAVDRRPGPA